MIPVPSTLTQKPETSRLSPVSHAFVLIERHPGGLYCGVNYRSGIIRWAG